MGHSHLLVYEAASRFRMPTILLVVDCRGEVNIVQARRAAGVHEQRLNEYR